MTLSRIILIFFLVISFTQLAGCKTPQETATKPVKRNRVEQVSERNQVESSAILVDGMRQKALGNWPQATLLFYEATVKDPNNDAAHFELAKIHAMQGEYVDAEKYAETAVGIDPDNHYYQMLMADVFILTNRMAQAIDIYKQLSLDYPDKIEFHHHLANAYIHDEQYSSALAILDYIESITGFMEDISLQKQKLLLEMGEYDRAISEAEKLLEAYPDEPMFYELLGELYTQTSQPEKAINIYKQLLEVEPGNPIAFLLIADYYQNQGDSIQSFEYLKDAFRSPDLPTDAKGQILYSFYMLSDEDENYLDQAIILCQILLDIHPEDADTYLIYGDFLNRKGNLQEARDIFLQGVELDPSNVNVWEQILVLDAMLEDFQAMRDHSDKALEYFFEHPSLFFFNGLANVSLKNYEDAASSLEYGLSITAADVEIKMDFLALLGDVYHYLQNHQKSDQYYEEALELDPSNATVLNNYSYHLAERKVRLEEAEEMSRNSIELEEGNAAFYDTYGWILYQMGRYEEAQVWIEKSVNSNQGESGVVLEHYGNVLYKLGQHEKALEYWNKALEAGDGSELLEKKVKNKSLYE